MIRIAVRAAMTLFVTAAPAIAATLISAVPIAGAPAGARAYAIRYRSIGFNGRPGEVTGVLFEPGGAVPRDGRPIVAWAHGTTGIAEQCAPSTSPRLLSLVPDLRPLLARGYVIVATDYAGLGTPGPHPFLVGDASARAVLDSVAAAREHPSAHAGTRFAVWGASQGGHAALWAGKLAGTQAPGLTLVGVAAAAPPTDLAANLSGGSDLNARAMLSAFTAASWAQVYRVPLSSIANPVGLDLIVRLARNCNLGDKPRLATAIGVVRLRRQLAGNDLTRIEPWRELLARNSVSTMPSGVPLLIAQGDADTIVAPAITARFVRGVCQGGVRVRWLPIAGGDHASVIARSDAKTLAWIADRFAGRAAPSDCGRL